MKATITLADSHGTIQTHAVSNVILMQVMELLYASPDCEKVAKLALPEQETAQPIPTHRVTPEKPVAVPVRDQLATPSTIREGTREGYVEILFDHAPGRYTLESLKGCGFRFSPRNGLWYGLESDLPESYAAIGVDRNETEYPSTVEVKEEPAKPDTNDFMSSLAALMAG